MICTEKFIFGRSLIINNWLRCSVQSHSHVWLFATTWTAAHKASLSIINTWSLLKLMSIELVMPSNHLMLCQPLLLLPSIFHSIRVFSNESVRIRWTKYSSFSFSISPSNDYSGLIYLGLTGLLSWQSEGLSRVFSNTTVQSINSLVLSFLCSPTLTTGKNIALTRWTSVGKVMSLLFNIPSSFSARSKHLLISWLQSPSTVILDPSPQK